MSNPAHKIVYNAHTVHYYDPDGKTSCGITPNSGWVVKTLSGYPPVTCKRCLKIRGRVKPVETISVAEAMRMLYGEC